MFPDDYDSDNIGFDLEMDNAQVNNNIDCNGIPQQIALVQVDGNDFRTTVQSLNFKQRDRFSLVCDWGRIKVKHLKQQNLYVHVSEVGQGLKSPIQ